MTPGAAKRVAIAYGVLCHGAFAVAIAMMATSLYTGMQLGRGGLHGAAAWAANACLIAQFPLGHSLLLTPSGRRWLSRLAPSRVGVDLATTTYVLVASLQVMVTFLLWSPSGVVWWSATGTARIALTAAFVGSWILLWKAMRDAGLGVQTGYLGWTSVLRGRKPVFGPMPTRGLFAFCRQPIYVSFTLTLWTVPVWSADSMVIASIWTLYCLLGPLHKEAIFAERYGSSFALYQRRVPYWIPKPARRERGEAAVTRSEDVAIYEAYGPKWWTSDQYLLRGLKALVRPRMKWFGKVAGSWSGRRILDLGCAGGFMSEAVAREGGDVIGVDPAVTAIDAARAHAAEEGLKIRYEVGRAEAIPLPDRSVDRVICVDVLEHVEDLAQSCREIARVLKPRGMLLFDTVNRTLLSRWIVIVLYERILRVAPRDTHDAAKLVRPGELRRHLESAGLACGRFVGLGPLGFNWRGDPVFARWPLLSVSYMGAAIRRPQTLRGSQLRAGARTLGRPVPESASRSERDMARQHAP